MAPRVPEGRGGAGGAGAEDVSGIEAKLGRRMYGTASHGRLRPSIDLNK